MINSLRENLKVVFCCRKSPVKAQRQKYIGRVLRRILSKTVTMLGLPRVYQEMLTNSFAYSVQSERFISLCMQIELCVEGTTKLSAEAVLCMGKFASNAITSFHSAENEFSQ